MEMMYIPGSSGCLYHLPSDSGELIPRLFAHSHEQVACIFQTEAGPMAMILIGATFTGSIETVWAGKTQSFHGKGKKIMNYNFRDVAIQLNQGQEMARFNMGGSAVLILFGPESVQWRPGLVAGMQMNAGNPLGCIEHALV
jgi:phosphatidylserine decarboxylase